VSRGTCWEGFGAVATSAIVIAVEGVERWWLWWCCEWQTNRECGGCGQVDRGGGGVVEVAPGDASRLSSREDVLPGLLQEVRAVYAR